MTKTAASILRSALDLGQEERAEVAAALLESLEPEVDENEIELAWRAEVRRRVESIDRGEVQRIPWESVRDELLARLNAKT